MHRALLRALHFMSTWSRVTRRMRPAIARYLNGDEYTRRQLDTRVEQLDAEIGTAMNELSNQRTRREAKEVRKWVRTATMRLAHRITKPIDIPIGYSASAAKCHKGERTPQLAADAGIHEWGGIWEAVDDEGPDDSDQILSMLESRSDEDDDNMIQNITLPTIDADDIDAGTRTFKNETGIGIDWLPPRLVSRMTRGAKQRLAEILNAIEKVKRWPSVVRAVVEIARAKKNGGARLIGLAPSLYRIWSRVRYLHVRIALEPRIARPFLAAAPGQGAQRAVQDAAWRCEHAAARGEHAAATTVDMKQHYEQISVAEIARGAKAHGLPLAITMLAADLYLSPRCIKVGQCVSKFVRPRKSVLAGCTWAMVFIRLIMIKPTEKFLVTLREQADAWKAKMDLTLYVDDGILVTIGHIDAVSFLHSWASRLLLQWIRQVLHKQTAAGKLHCIASSSSLRKRLATGLNGDGFAVDTYGELLGMGFAAGGKIKKRTTNAARLRKSLRRKGRLKWLRDRGGKAMRVVKEGVKPAVNYEASVTGIDNRTMVMLRRAHGATCRVRCGGASLTARLAIGGGGFQGSRPVGPRQPDARCCGPVEGLGRTKETCRASDNVAKGPRRDRRGG